MQEVNLTSVYLCCKAALPHMLEQGRGSIINTASFVAVMGAATSQISYSASKGGVLSMSRDPAMERLAAARQIELAGRSFGPDQPSNRCRDCEHAWSRQAS